jgi:hypothetical protein
MNHVLGAISEFDKAMTVAKLHGARERKRAATAKCEGRKSHAESSPISWLLPSSYGAGLRTVAIRLAAMEFY